MSGPAQPAARQALPARRWILDLTAIALLLAVPIAGFWPTFDGPGYLIAALGGAALGLAIASAGALFRWGVLLISGVTVLAYFVFGAALALPHTALAGVIPTLDTLGQLALGAVTSWKQLLTTVAPVAASDGHLVVPMILSLLAAVLAGCLALRARHAAWALLPVAVFLAIQIAIGTSQPAAPLLQGVVFAVVAVAWLAVRQAWAPASTVVSLGGERSATGAATSRRLTAGGLIVAVAVLAGVATNAFAAPTGPRYVLRDVVIPPFDIREYPSPLQAFRGYVRDSAEDPLFTVSGLPEDARVRVATMDAYNGTVFNVSDEGADSSSAFTPVRSNMSADAEGAPVSIRFEVEDYSSVWMPDAGAVTSVEFEGDRADDLRRTTHYNEATGTAVVTSRLQAGDAYTISTVIPSVPDDGQLADQAFAPVKMPRSEDAPEGLADIASKAVADATTPVEQVRALQTMLSRDGFFSHGLEGEALSRAGHGAQRIATLFGSEQMVGDDEQYATSMALLAGEIGIPARVVMGFYPDEGQSGDGVFTATGDSLHAWVEVAFEDAGWVPFDPTPPEDQLPNEQTTKPRADPKPQVLQPPPPEQEPVDLPPIVPDDRESEDEEDAGALAWLPIIGIALGSLGVLALLAAPFILIAAVKAARRRRRRDAERAWDRITGGWEEVVDRATDYGTPIRPGGTRSEEAQLLSAAFAQPAVGTLAIRADAEVFGPSEPSPDDVAEFWKQVDEIVGSMGTGRSRWKRLRARFSLRSLLAGTRFARNPKAPG
ncbi:transglutaminase-like domain-containing protein [Microbacterium pygmaeum]|uniref:Transglutaminase-like superfamily protein n=1 Tax=Microbacterium pygmaeum TaxID=370764 RepID=A0A1G7U7V2_9MICO|nr:transglutaminase-like domain-containing protein [Microbacterium pygmaeum]SDG43129.1 Transglutaminase-like superfamily protein [Microbacterium pygmaeum]